ncbi:putative UMP/CMP kinase-like [Capsicum annuum]|nr:putative UMP/CMP kinase-like [Capsicum annuum]KAF3659208.1 putative UMP/CMP kinase-like [Capsicum annuum]
MHRGTSKVISVAITNVRDLRNTLPSLTDNYDARVIGKLITERSKEVDVHAIAYEPGKNERIEGRLGLILDTIKKMESYLFEISPCVLLTCYQLL